MTASRRVLRITLMLAFLAAPLAAEAQQAGTGRSGTAQRCTPRAGDGRPDVLDPGNYSSA